MGQDRLGGRSGAGPAVGIPNSTYRVQFHRGFDFHAGREIVPYLHDLGIDCLYASPICTARTGSLHGYDTVDPTTISAELGGEEGFIALACALHERRMGLLLDVVPNHCAADADNLWWMDVLENGRKSRFAHFFDIGWRHEGRGHEVMLVPLLGAPLEDCVARGEIVLAVEEFDRAPSEPERGRYPGQVRISPLTDRAALFVRYHEQRFPLAPGSYEYLAAVLAQDERTMLQPGVPGPAWPGANRDMPGTFGGLLEDIHPEHVLRLLSMQHYRLCAAETASHRFAYRRFFNVNDLVGLRVQEQEVFDATHALLFDLVGEGLVDGVRVDHIDGLYDPAEYLAKLRRRLDERSGRRFFILVEKILNGMETLPPWPVEGTTGYDFMNDLEHLFVDPDGVRHLDAGYRSFTGIHSSPERLSQEAKYFVIKRLFGGELDELTERLVGLAGSAELTQPENAEGRQSLSAALAHVSCALPVYRTYTRDFSPAPRDLALIGDAIEVARRRAERPGLDLLVGVLLLDAGSPIVQADPDGSLDFVMRWQQLTGPVAAKGVEDTALYRYHRLLALSDVGVDPRPFCQAVDRFHRRNLRMRRDWPFTLNASSTHDTKRSEDVRARIAALSELAENWTDGLPQWSRLSGSTHGGPSVEANDVELLYQTLLGIWPFDGNSPDRAEIDGLVERLSAFLIKASREAKLRSDWAHPNVEYESALSDLARSIMGSGVKSGFVGVQQDTAWLGMLNSLSAVVAKVFSPGIPDFYQGTELWDLSLVDPDNRRPVDFALRVRLLREFEKQNGNERDTRVAALHELRASWRDGRLKLFITQAALLFRRAHGALFTFGEYLPLAVEGSESSRVFAFARRRKRNWAICVMVRLAHGVAPAVDHWPGEQTWGDTAVILPETAPTLWAEMLTGIGAHTVPGKQGGRRRDAPVGPVMLPAGPLLAELPVAILFPATPV